ncbi:MAG TPA: MFS transporter [Microvirga sp.]|nr:MFS transporter [Microvirga sp.]
MSTTSAPKALGARLSALHAATFMGIGVYQPFFPVWLQSKAVSPTLIGVILAIPIVVRILLTTPLLSLADHATGPRRLLMASHLGQVVCYPVLMVVDDGLAIAVLMAVIATFQTAVVPANDLVTTAALRRHRHLHYGRLRGWGSVAFLLASIAAGYLVDATGAGVVVWALALTPVLGLLATHLAVPAAGDPDIRPAEAVRERPGRLPAVLWLLLIAAALTQASHAGVYAFGSIHWRTSGFSDATIGYFWATGVVAEIAVFYGLGRAVGHGSAGLGLLLLGSGAAAVRFAALATDPGLAATFALQALHGLSFGATHLGTMAALAALAPESARGRAQGLAGSVVALGAATATVASGEIYRAAGPAVFAAMAPLGAGGFVLMLLAVRRLRAQDTSSG